MSNLNNVPLQLEVWKIESKIEWVLQQNIVGGSYNGIGHALLQAAWQAAGNASGDYLACSYFRPEMIPKTNKLVRISHIGVTTIRPGEKKIVVQKRWNRMVHHTAATPSKWTQLSLLNTEADISCSPGYCFFLTLLKPNQVSAQTTSGLPTNWAYIRSFEEDRVVNIGNVTTPEYSTLTGDDPVSTGGTQIAFSRDSALTQAYTFGNFAI